MPEISLLGERFAAWVEKIYNFVNEVGIGGAIKHGFGMIWPGIQEFFRAMFGKKMDPEKEAELKEKYGKAGYDVLPGGEVPKLHQQLDSAASWVDTFTPDVPFTGGFKLGTGTTDFAFGQMYDAAYRYQGPGGLNERTDPMEQRLYGGKGHESGITEKNMSDEMMMEYLNSGETNVPDFLKNRRQLGGSVPGGPGQGVPAMLHGGEEVIPRDVVQAMEAAQGGVLGGFFGTMGEQIAEQAQRINSYVQEFKTQEGGAGGTIATFDSTVLEGDLPAIWTGIDDYLSGIGSQAKDAANAATKLDFSNLADFDIDLDLPTFQPPQEVFDELKMCFMAIQTCINANLEAMPVAVQNEANRIQAMLDEAGALIAAGRGGEVDFAAIGAAINAFNGSVQDNINKITESFNVKTSEIHSIMGMSYEEFVGMDEGLFGAANYFGSAVGQMGTYLTTMRETAIANLKHRPCTASEKTDFYNDRCFEGCTAAMTSSKGHPCYQKPSDPKPVIVPDEEVVEAVEVALEEKPPTNRFEAVTTMLNARSAAGFELGQKDSAATVEASVVAAVTAMDALGGWDEGIGPIQLPDAMDQLGIQYISPKSGVMHFAFDPDEFYSGGIVPGRQGAPRLIRAHGGERITPNSSPGGGSRATSNRVLNVTINARGGLADVIGEIQRFEDMDEASFFNSVL